MFFNALRNPYSKHYDQVVAPPNPYVHEIQNGFRPGKHVFIRGTPTGNRFVVDLETNDGVALHLNPRFDQHSVVRNTMHHGHWQHEERNGAFPFSHGQVFEIDIYCQDDKYTINVNKGAAVYEYKHRQAYQDVKRVKVHGDLQIEKVTLFADAPRNFNEVVPNSIPFTIPLHNNRPGKMVQLQGHTHHHTNRFSVNLQNGAGDHCDISLHFSVRFDDPYNGQVVVRTNKKGGWGAEERDGAHFPFVKGGPFEILILFDAQHYKVAVNGRHFVEFAYRNPQDADFLYVEGDVAITSVREF